MGCVDIVDSGPHDFLPQALFFTLLKNTSSIYFLSAGHHIATSNQDINWFIDYGCSRESRIYPLKGQGRGGGTLELSRPSVTFWSPSVFCFPRRELWRGWLFFFPLRMVAGSTSCWTSFSSSFVFWHFLLLLLLLPKQHCHPKGGGARLSIL